MKKLLSLILVLTLCLTVISVMPITASATKEQDLNFRVANLNFGIELTWNELDNVDYYIIERNNRINSSQLSNWDCWKSVDVLFAPYDPRIVDIYATTGKYYKYRMTVMFKDGTSFYVESEEIRHIRSPKVTIENTTGGVSLSWTYDYQDITNSSTIYRSMYVSGRWTGWEKLSSGYDSWYLDKTVPAGRGVRYKVEFNEWIWKAETFQSGTFRRMATPRLSATNVSNGIKVSWNKLAGAKKYYVYRRTLIDNGYSSVWSDWKYVKSTTSLNFTDTSLKSGDMVRYMVCGVDGESRSEYGAIAPIYRLDTPEVETVNDKSGVSVTWNTVEGAEKYYVYKSTYSNGKWSNWRYTKGTTGTKFVDTGVYNGQYVKYQVTAIATTYEHPEGIRSLFGTTSTQRFIAAPNATAAVVANGIKLNFNAISGAQKYYIYRSEYRNGRWTGWKYAGGTTGTYFTDTKAPVGIGVRYYVQAIDRTYKSGYISTATIKR